jgi:hypothetical protein
MHSKWQIWDFFSSFNREHLKNYRGVLGIAAFDPICLKMLKDFLLKGAIGRVVHHKSAADVTKSWIEEEFQTLSLFGGSDSFIIHQAQDLKSDSLDFFSALELNDRFIILSFETENATWKKNLKENKFETLSIEAPRFWELNKLLDFVCAYLRLPLSYEAKIWILDSLENDLSTFYHSGSLLKLNFPDAKEVGLTDVRSLFSLEKLDQFLLASLFARKKFSSFYERLIALEGDFEKMRFFFNFMQSHLVKLSDTSYLSQKPRLTQYDRDLQSTSKLWSAQDLYQEIEKFNQWEISCKKKDSNIWHELRKSHLVALEWNL